MKLLIAFLLTAASFPVELTQRVLPYKPRKFDLMPSKPGGRWHFWKNYFIEHFSADKEWWVKCFCFVITVQFIISIILGVL
jgi:hypothetical protein